MARVPLISQQDFHPSSSSGLKIWFCIATYINYSWQRCTSEDVRVGHYNKHTYGAMALRQLIGKIPKGHKVISM